MASEPLPHAGAWTPAMTAAVTLFNDGKYLAAHELWEELWEGTEGPDSDFYKGLIQAAIALHHFQSGNRDGAAKLYRGHRRYLAHYLPTHLEIDVAGFLAAMRTALQPLERGEAVEFSHATRPRVERVR